jgi:hypothetical protein
VPADGITFSGKGTEGAHTARLIGVVRHWSDLKSIIRREAISPPGEGIGLPHRAHPAEADLLTY